jgi:hypothetical protein
MEHISSILARVAPPEPAPPEPDEVPAWRRAAGAAHRIARSRRRDAASLAQLIRVCQLLSSHVVTEQELRRACRCLAEGCTRSQASRMLDYLIPRVRERRAAESDPHPGSC